MTTTADRILAVDDDHILLEFVEDVLSSSHSVIRATDGSEAIEVFRAQSESVVLVLLDLGMPEMSGYAALVEMLMIDPDVKVVVITGLEPDMNRLSGVQHVLTKPFLAQDLTDVVEEVLGS